MNRFQIIYNAFTVNEVNSIIVAMIYFSKKMLLGCICKYQTSHGISIIIEEYFLSISKKIELNL